MPQGASKATGLKTMLETLRRSAHNMVAIGDAENDHEMLRLAEVGAAVDGEPGARAAADTVVAGPARCAEFIQTSRGWAHTRAAGARRLRLGYTVTAASSHLPCAGAS